MLTTCLLLACLNVAQPLVLVAGQSNAVYLEPHLGFEGAVTLARSSTGIGAWHPDGDMWPATEAVLKAGTIRAVVWWQGEADRHAANYLDELRELVRRMRVAAGNPALRIVVVRVLNKPANQSIRTAQTQFVKSDPHARLLSTDGLGLGDSDHLTVEGYRIVARRLRAIWQHEGIVR
jgi:hypothetical protein